MVKQADVLVKHSVFNKLQLKPFVLNKARVLGKKYTLDELSRIMARLLDAYHAREHGGPELDISLERLILTV